MKKSLIFSILLFSSFFLNAQISLSDKDIHEYENQVHQMVRYLQETLKKWCKFKTTYDGDDEEELTPEYEEFLTHDEFPEVRDLKQHMARLDDLYEEWKLRIMGLTLKSHVVVTKETKELEAKFASSSDFVNPH